MGDGYWVDDNQDSANNWYGQPQQQQQTDFGWGQFDYSNTQQNAPSGGNVPQDNYYAQQQQYSGYSQQGGYGGYPGGNNAFGGNMFIPGNGGASAGDSTDDFENEPPLLEELGINFSHIKEKTIAVLNPVGGTSLEVIADQDLAGPLVFCLLFGAALLLHGKMQFGYIYGIGSLGCVGMYFLMNLMSPDTTTISFTCTASVLGYCLLPMSILSLLSAILSFKGIVGYIVSSMAVLWCSLSSSKLFVTALSLDHQRLLVAYPCALLYAVFALLAIF